MANLVFDYDSTLHDCIRIYGPAFRLAYASLEERGLAAARTWTDDEISIWLGCTAKDMWNQFAPSLPPREKDRCCGIIGKEMLQLTALGQARLYPGVFQMLDSLKAKGHTLLFLSNCRQDYMAAHRRYFNLDRYFSGFYCAQDFGWMPKHEIFPAIKGEFHGRFLIIGDRYHDMETARKYAIQSIGCMYGYGAPEELSGADRLAGCPLDIEKAVDELEP